MNLTSQRCKVWQLVDDVADAKVRMVLAQETYDKLHSELLAILNDKFPLTPE